MFSLNGATFQVYDFDLEGAPCPVKINDFKKLSFCSADIDLMLSKNLLPDHGYRV